jgi:hypothetical protein
MKRLLSTLICVGILMTLCQVAPPAWGGGGCSVVVKQGDPRNYWSNCQSGSTHHGGGPLGRSGGGGSSRYYRYIWLPTCPNAQPGDPGSQFLDCRQAHTCADPFLLLQSLWGQIVDRSGGVIVPWHYLTSECRDQSKVGPTQRHQLSWEDIRDAIRRIGVPAAEVEGPAYTLVNLRTTFYTHVEAFDRSFVSLGFHVDVHITPTSYIWHWGDGATTTTHTPGRPYPATDVTHTYRHATDLGATLPLRVDVAYHAQFRVDGGDWTIVNDQLVIAGTTRQLPVKQASAVLVPGG